MKPSSSYLLVWRKTETHASNQMLVLLEDEAQFIIMKGMERIVLHQTLSLHELQLISVTSTKKEDDNRVIPDTGTA